MKETCRQQESERKTCVKGKAGLPLGVCDIKGHTKQQVAVHKLTKGNLFFLTFRVKVQ